MTSVPPGERRAIAARTARGSKVLDDSNMRRRRTIPVRSVRPPRARGESRASAHGNRDASRITRCLRRASPRARQPSERTRRAPDLEEALPRACRDHPNTAACRASNVVNRTSVDDAERGQGTLPLGPVAVAEQDLPRALVGSVDQPASSTFNVA
jgi:hypothetical protein